MSALHVPITPEEGVKVHDIIVTNGPLLSYLNQIIYDYAIPSVDCACDWALARTYFTVDVVVLLMGQLHSSYLAHCFLSAHWLWTNIQLVRCTMRYLNCYDCLPHPDYCNWVYAEYKQCLLYRPYFEKMPTVSQLLFTQSFCWAPLILYPLQYHPCMVSFMGIVIAVLYCYQSQAPVNYYAAVLMLFLAISILHVSASIQSPGYVIFVTLVVLFVTIDLGQAFVVYGAWYSLIHCIVVQDHNKNNHVFWMIGIWFLLTVFLQRHIYVYAFVYWCSVCIYCCMLYV